MARSILVAKQDPPVSRSSSIRHLSPAGGAVHTATANGSGVTGRKWLAAGYLGLLLLMAAGLVALMGWSPDGLPAWPPAVRYGGLVVMAFFCEYVDSSLGMGYGTILTPVLVLLGFPLEAIVPAVLLSEALTGLAAGGFHHFHGNVDWRADAGARKTLSTLALCSTLGAAAAVLLAVNLPKNAVNLYIAAMVAAIGLFLCLRARRRNGSAEPTPAGGAGRGRIIALGLVAAFNKGVSGGGYGPLMTGGQVLSGVPERAAVAITSLAESGVCVLGFTLYVVARGWPAWDLAIPLCAGALASVPLATWTVRMLPPATLRRAIGGGTLFLGLLLLAKTLWAGH